MEPLGVHDRPGLDAAFTAMRRRLPDALMTIPPAVRLRADEVIE